VHKTLGQRDPAAAFLLALAKRRTGQQLGDQALIGDAAQSAFWAFTSAAALLGIGLNAWLG
jgi:divalent metal cation (Fe/Co/Zn/Cd) transporter